MTLVVYASTTSSPVTCGLKPSGALWIDGLTPSGASSASRSATCFVYSRALWRPPVRLVDVFLDHLLLEHAVDERVGGVEIQVVVGEELLERRPLGRVLRERSADGAEVRRQTPNFWSGATRAFTCGR